MSPLKAALEVSDPSLASFPSGIEPMAPEAPIALWDEMTSLISEFPELPQGWEPAEDGSFCPIN